MPLQGKGRPRVGDCRIEVTVPRAVFDLLLERERVTDIYRTRIAADVLCQWASRETGKVVRSYKSFRA